MTISTITIGGNDYISYASVAEADVRIAVDPVRIATWATLTDDQKGSHLVAATNRLDTMNWAGEKAGGATQLNAWPRSGVTYADGTAVPPTDVPAEVEDATILLAGSIAIKPSNSGAGSSGTNVSEAKAGSAAVKFFRPLAGVPMQDEDAYALIKIFLGGAASDALTGKATGTDGASNFCNPDPYELNRGYP